MTYTIDPKHSSASFKIRHMMIANVRGEFNSVNGTVTIDGDNVAGASVDATIDVNSLHTGDAARDGHLKAGDFFDAENHPTITFKSNGTGGAGTLTLRGVSKPVTLTIESVSGEITDPWSLSRRGATASVKINRADFGMGWNAPIGGGVMLSEEVEIALDIEMTRTA